LTLWMALFFTDVSSLTGQMAFVFYPYFVPTGQTAFVENLCNIASLLPRRICANAIMSFV
jgi:hypothetical protein